MDFRGLKCRHFNELEIGITDELPGQPQKRLFKVVVAFGTNVVILHRIDQSNQNKDLPDSLHSEGDLADLEVLLSMECDGLRLDLAVLDIHFIATQHNGDVLTDTYQVSMPVWHILVRDSGCDIKHYDGTLSLDVVSISKPAKLLLASCIPDIETNWSSVCVEN